MHIIQKLKNSFLALAVIAAGVVLPLSPVAVYASPQSQICQGASGASGSVKKDSRGNVIKDASGNAIPDCSGSSFSGFIKSVINVLLFIIGVAAVIMIIIGGMRYVVSGGDPAGIKGAKDTILYAVIGLVVAILAFAIVNFVVTSVK